MSDSQTAKSAGWKAVIAEMFEGAREAAFRFPVTAFCLFLLAADTNLHIADIFWFFDIGWHLSLSLLAAVMASLAATLWCEANGKSFGLSIAISAACAVLAGVAVWYADQTRAWEFVILPALAGLVVIAPYLWRGTSGTFWLFAARLVFAVMLGGLALLLGAGGVSAIFASLQFLFGVDIPEEYYLYLWSTVGLFLAPLFGLGRLPSRYNEQVVADSRQYMSLGMRALGDFVAAPLLIIYALILHAYAAKVLLTGEVPKNQIGWLVLGYGFCVFGSLLLTAPFWSVARAPMRLFLKVWPFVMPVPLALLFYAASLRISQYGITPERYLLVLYGSVATLVVLAQLAKPLRGDIRLIVALPVLALCIASFGPQGVIGASVNSQVQRFQQLIASQPIDRQTEAEAVSALRFLARYNGLVRVKPDDLVLEERKPWRRRYDYENLKRVAEAYGLDPDIYSDRNANLAFYRYFQQGRALDSAGFDLIQPQVHLFENRAGNAKRIVKLPEGDLELSLSQNVISAKWREQIHSFEISEDRILQLADAPSADPQSVDLRSGAKHIRLLMWNLNGERLPEPKITNMSATLLVRSADWP
ncbi:MAG: DUF4153 domain-containing protein [Rhizobiaceae bacterium]